MIADLAAPLLETMTAALPASKAPAFPFPSRPMQTKKSARVFCFLGSKSWGLPALA
jgi:hypothetical protein